MEKLKIVHTLYAGLGGHGNVVFPLLETEFGRIHHNFLVYYGIEPVLDSYNDMSIELGIKSHSILKKPKRYIKSFRDFSEILVREKPNCIFVHCSELIIPAIRYRNKNKNCFVYYIEHENHETKGFILKKMSSYAGRKADGIICLNQKYAEKLKEKFRISVPITVIPNGINTNKFKVVDQKDLSETIFGMASRMIPSKDHISLLKAFKLVLKKYPFVKLHIAGEGLTLNDIKKLAHELDLNDNVTFLGLLSEDEMVKFYKHISIYVLATTSETLSTAILQAMSCSLRIITSDIENNKILIKDGLNGLLYENMNSINLSEKMIFCLDNLKVDNQLGKKARENVLAEYSNVQMFEKYNSLITHKKN